jgi:hypothetical protein
VNGVHDLGGTDGLGPNKGHHEAHREPVAVDPAR